MRRKFAIAAVLCFMILGVALWSLDPRSYNSYLEGRLAAVAAQAGLRLEVNDLRISLLGARAAKLEMFMPRAFTQVEFSNLLLKFQPTSLLRLKPHLLFETGFYQGRILGQALYLGPQSGRAELEFGNIDLKTHPQLRGLGIEGGLLSGAGKNIEVFPGRTKVEKWQVTVKDGQKSGVTRLPAWVSGLPIDIEIPEILNLQLQADGSVEPNTLQIKELITSCNLGRLEMTGAIGWGPNSRSRQLDLKLKVHLSKRGLEILGNYLPLISSGKITNTQQAFDLTILGPSRTPALSFKAGK